MGGDVEMHDPPAIVREDDEHEQDPERGRGHHEEVHRRELCRVSRQERTPGLRRRPPRPAQVLGDGGLRDLDAQLEQFRVNPRRAPEGIGLLHLADEVPGLPCDGWPARVTRLGPPAPVEGEALAVPRDDGVRRDDLNSVSPPTPRAGEEHPDHAVHAAHAQALGCLPAQNRQLMAEGKDLGGQFEARPGSGAQGGDDGGGEQHRLSLRRRQVDKYYK